MVDSPQVNQIIKKQNYYEIQIQAYLNDAQTSFPISYSYKYQNTFSRNVQFHFCCLVLLVCQPKERNRRLLSMLIFKFFIHRSRTCASCEYWMKLQDYIIIAYNDCNGKHLLRIMYRIQDTLDTFLRYVIHIILFE